VWGWLAAVVCAVLVLGLAVAIATEVVPLPFGHATAGSSSSPTAGSPTAGGSSPTASASSAFDPTAGLTQFVKDSLTPAANWPADNINAANEARCQSTPAGLVVTHALPGPFRCRKNPPDLLLYDTAVFVDVELLDANSCAGIWLRFDNNVGYLLQICLDGYHLAVHGKPTSGAVVPLCSPVPAPLAVNQKERVGVVVRGNQFTFLRDGQQVGRGLCTDPDNNFSAGHPVLGIYTLLAVTDPAQPNGVRMTNVELWGSTT
jgi:hypothetical protein